MYVSGTRFLRFLVIKKNIADEEIAMGECCDTDLCVEILGVHGYV